MKKTLLFLCLGLSIMFVFSGCRNMTELQIPKESVEQEVAEESEDTDNENLIHEDKQISEGESDDDSLQESEEDSDVIAVQINSNNIGEYFGFCIIETIDEGQPVYQIKLRSLMYDKGYTIVQYENTDLYTLWGRKEWVLPNNLHQIIGDMYYYASMPADLVVEEYLTKEEAEKRLDSISINDFRIVFRVEDPEEYEYEGKEAVIYYKKIEDVEETREPEIDIYGNKVYR